MPYVALPLASGANNGAAYQISDDGHVAIGYTGVPGVPNNSERNACYWVNGTGPTVIDSNFSEAYGVSSNGSIISGNGHTGTPFRWTAATGAVPFGISGDAVQGMSADGSVTIGTRQVSGEQQACFWNASGVITLLGYLPGHNVSVPYEVSADGSVIVGESYNTSDLFNTERGFRWTAATGMVNLGVVGTATGSRAFGVSDDGSIVAGALQKPSNSDAFRWTAAGGMVEMPFMYNATGVSGDGNTIIGINGALGSSSYFCYWTASGGLVTPDGNPTDPTDANGTFVDGVSADGTHFVGYSYGSLVLPWLYVIGGPPPTHATLTDSELAFGPTGGFIDFTNASNRRLFVSTNTTPQWLGPNGALAFGGTIPPVYLTTLGPPLNFAQNNGSGGSFVPTQPITGAGGPGCTPYYVTEAAGPAANPEWRLTVSDDGGRTWSTLVKPRSIGALGQYLTRLRWLKMGHSRERMIRLECSDPVRRNVVGFYIDVTAGMG